MPTYVALLRGINVGGKRVKMDDLRKSFESLGHEQVQTYIQSGNVVFKTRASSAASLQKTIEDQLERDFGFPVSVVVRSSTELAAAIEANPLLQQRGINHERLHVTFLSEVPRATALKKLAEYTLVPDQSCCVEKHIYLHLPNGFSQSSLWKAPWEKALGVVTTTRNWNTVNKLHEMCRACG